MNHPDPRGARLDCEREVQWRYVLAACGLGESHFPGLETIDWLWEQRDGRAAGESQLLHARIPGSVRV